MDAAARVESGYEGQEVWPRCHLLSQKEQALVILPKPQKQDHKTPPHMAPAPNSFLLSPPEAGWGVKQGGRYQINMETDSDFNLFLPDNLLLGEMMVHYLI